MRRCGAECGWDGCRSANIAELKSRKGSKEMRGALTWLARIVSVRGAPRLLGRPRVPVVQWLGHRPFTAVTRVRIPSGTPNIFKHLQDSAFKNVGSKRFNKDFRVSEVLFYAFSPSSGT